jgi:hypothetical protein
MANLDGMHDDAAADQDRLSKEDILAEIADRAADLNTRNVRGMSRLRARLEAIDATIDLRDQPDRPLRADRVHS